MYSEGRNTFVRDIVIKILLVLLFIFLLIWLFPMPNLNPFYDRIFGENIKSMKEVAKSYYTVERLPKNIGDKEKITLQEMIDKKMIIPFVDKDGKSCSTTDSYVEVVRMDTEYLFKTYLSCPSKTDYVVDYFGCYDVCKGNNCEQKCTKTQTEYEFTRTTTNKVVDYYVCPAGYILNGKTCVKTVDNTDTQSAIISCKSGYKYNETSKMCEKTVTSEKDADIKCPSGFVYNTTSKKCLKSTGESRNPDITCITYPGYEYNSSTGKCTKPILYQEDADKTSCSAYPGYTYNPTSKMCESSTPDEKPADKTDCSAYPGYEYNPSTGLCEAAADEKPADKTDCSVYPGYTYNAISKMCEAAPDQKPADKTACSGSYKYNPTSKLCEITSTTAMCSTGTYSGGKCVITVAWNNKYTTWKYSYPWYDSPKPQITQELFRRSYVLDTQDGRAGCTGSACFIVWYNYEEATRSRTCDTNYTYNSSNNTCTQLTTAKICSGDVVGQNCVIKSTQTPTYTCAAYPDYTQNGSICIKAKEPKTPEYTCVAYPGYTRSGIKCIKAKEPKTPEYTCAAYPGYTRSGTKCIKDKEPKTPGYTCSRFPGYDLNGSKCEKIVISEKTPTKTCVAYPGYSYNLVTDKCEKTTNEDANPTYECTTGTKKAGDQTKCIISSIDKIDSYYGCPTSYILNDNNNTCYKTSKTDDKKDAEAIYKNATKTEYTWSKYSTLSGWKATGKTRTKEVACTE